MTTSRRPWLRVPLCSLLAVSGLSPAAPAFSATVQTQSAVQSAVPRIGGIPVWSNPGGLGSPQLGGSLLAPSLLSSIPYLPAPEVKVGSPLSAPVAAAAVSLAAIPLAAPQSLAPAEQKAPVSLFQGLLQTDSSISTAQDQGGEKTGKALDALYGESSKRQAEVSDPVTGTEGPAAHLQPRGVAAPSDAKTAPPAAAQPAAELSSLDKFVAFAKGLFFPDGRAAGIISHRGVHPEGMPTDEQMYKDMELSPLTYEERLNAVIELFKKGGAKPEEIITQDVGAGQKNVYVVKKGRTDRVIVVGSHHDKVDVGAGTIDNWTGTTMVTNLYQAMHDMDTEATIIFASFAREEDGLIGSAKFLKALTPAQRKKIDANVNLDTLAVDGTFSWQNNSTRSLLDLVQKVATQSKLDLKEAYLDGGDADSSSFRRYGIAAVTLFGASMDVIFDIIHSERDTMAAFSMPHYKNAYLLTLALLKMLNLTPVGPDNLAPAAAAA
ncbi:MAG: M28 family peptidase [Elusimicrobia bacterium]|nr:M28 family peptidase [Elusimicrobiota bacterium]